jgi:hypothetical protein
MTRSKTKQSQDKLKEESQDKLKEESQDKLKEELEDKLKEELSQLRLLLERVSRINKRLNDIYNGDKRPQHLKKMVSSQNKVLYHLAHNWIGEEISIDKKIENWLISNENKGDGNGWYLGWCLDLFNNRLGKPRGCWREVEYRVKPSTHKISIHYLGWDHKYDREIDMDSFEDRRCFYPYKKLLNRLCYGNKKIKKCDGEQGSSYACFKLDGFKLDERLSYKLTDNEVEGVYKV